jgi:regulator of nonsense transcripts 2
MHTLNMLTTGGEGVAFKMLKRGAKGKLEAQAVFIPQDTNLAAQAQRHSTKESDEREIIKARVLQYEADQHALEAARSRGDIAAEPLPMMRNAPITAEAARRAAQKGGGRGKGSGRSYGRSFSFAGRGPFTGQGPMHDGTAAPRL